MRFFSSNLFLFAMIAFLGGCSLKHSENPRKFIPKMDFSRYQDIRFDENEANLLPDIYEPSTGMQPCSWLTGLPQAKNHKERFRLLGDVNFLNEADSLDVAGAVDIGASPLYQYALQIQEIPDAVEFMSLIDQEIEKNADGTWKIRMFRWLINIGVLDVHEQRNQIIQEKMNDAFPGAFKSESRNILFGNSIPGAVFRNGNPRISEFSVLSTDSSSERQKKANQLNGILSQYIRPVRIFSAPTWKVFSQEMRSGLSIALRNLNNKNPQEQACATVVLHRSFAQLMWVMGFNRLPTEVDTATDLTHLPNLNNLLDTPNGRNLRRCSGPGSFIRNNNFTMLSRTDIAEYDEEKSPLTLSRTPFSPEICNLEQSPSKNIMAGSTASASELLHFVNGITHFLISFNPRSHWWSDGSAIGFPLSPFESLERIKISGAVLPSDAHALSLGLLNLGFSILKKKHFVFLDINQKELQSSAGAAGIRISETQRGENDFGKTPVVTTLDSSVALMEIAFKLSNSLWRLNEWKKSAEESLRDDLSQEKDPKKKREIARDYKEFIETMFGSEDNLLMLTSNDSGSLRVQLNDLKLASALLAVNFAKRETGKRLTCFQELTLDVSTGMETKEGICSAEQLQNWKYTLGIVAKSFQSPLFQLILQE